MSIRSKLAASHFKIHKPDANRYKRKARVYALLKDEFRGTPKNAPKQYLENKLKKLQGNPDLDALKRLYPNISLFNYAARFASKGVFEVYGREGLTYRSAIKVVKTLSTTNSPTRDGTVAESSSSSTLAEEESAMLQSDTLESDLIATPIQRTFGNNEASKNDLDLLLEDHLNPSKQTQSKSKGSHKFKSSAGSKHDLPSLLATEHDQHTDTFEVDNVRADKIGYLLEDVTSATPPCTVLKLPDMNVIELSGTQDIIPETGRLRLFEMQDTSIVSDDDLDQCMDMIISDSPTVEHAKIPALLTSVTSNNSMEDDMEMTISKPTGEYTRLPTLQELGFGSDLEHALDLSGLRLYGPSLEETPDFLNNLGPVEDVYDHANDEPQLQAPITLEDAISPTDLWTSVLDSGVDTSRDARNALHSVDESEDSPVTEVTLDQNAAPEAPTILEPILEQPAKGYEECLAQLSVKIRNDDTESSAAENISENVSAPHQSISSDQAPPPKTRLRRRKDSPLATYKPIQPVPLVVEKQAATFDVDTKPVKSVTVTVKKQEAITEAKTKPVKPVDESQSAQTDRDSTIYLDKHKVKIAKPDSPGPAVDDSPSNAATDKQTQQASAVKPTTKKILDWDKTERIAIAARNDSRPKDEKAIDSFSEISRYATMPIPQTHALYLPYRTQYRILCRLQTSLEAVCFDYLKREHPALLEGTTSQWEIDCPESLELHKYIQLIKKHAEFDAQTLHKVAQQPVSELYMSLRWLRHYTVHRNKASIKYLRIWTNNSYAFARLLGDHKASYQFSRLSLKLKHAHRALTRRKVQCEEMLLNTVKELAAKRAELDRLEKEAIEAMVKANSLSKDYEFQALEDASNRLMSVLEEDSEQTPASEPSSGVWSWFKSWFGA